MDLKVIYKNARCAVLEIEDGGTYAVSYTHLDVYKRQCRRSEAYLRLMPAVLLLTYHSLSFSFIHSFTSSIQP